MGRGPRVLDVAMTLVGCCYDRSTNLLRFDLARPFVQSYSRFATLDERERQAFIPFLRWALLAIAYWSGRQTHMQIPPPCFFFLSFSEAGLMNILQNSNRMLLGAADISTRIKGFT
jgi:Ser/Thr protein kinase RdoA (MazF antagonist)